MDLAMTHVVASLKNHQDSFTDYQDINKLRFIYSSLTQIP